MSTGEVATAAVHFDGFGAPANIDAIVGLSIVRHLAEAHGGRVRAESMVSRGTTVAAFFPDEHGPSSRAS